MESERAVHEGLPLRIEAFPQPGPDCVRIVRDARALRVDPAGLVIVTPGLERIGAVLRVRASEAIGPEGQFDLVTRVVACALRRDGQHQLSLAILGTDRERKSKVRKTESEARYSAPIAS